MKKNAPAAARRYARALFDIANKQGQAEAVNGTLQALAALLRGNRELNGVLQRPTVSAARKKAILHAVVGAEADLASRFLDILIDKGRMIDVADVADGFESLWQKSRNIQRARVVSAAVLDEPAVAALRSALETLTGAGIVLETRVDPELVGGLTVSVGGLTYDGSVRTQLGALRARLSGQA